MSYKTIEYTVYDDKIMPNTLQAGGIAGDDNAVRVKFDLNNITLAADDIIRIEISNGVGGFNSSEHLTVADGCVYYDLPFDVTSAGGTAVLHLVICSCKDNVEQAVRYSYPAKIYFEESDCGSISYKQYKQGLSGLALECKLYSENAQTAADEAESAADEANQYMSAAQSFQTAAKESADAAKASAESAASKIDEHNTDNDAHSAKFSVIQSQINDKVNATFVNEAVSAHNSDSAAHGALFGSIKMNIQGISSGLASAVEKGNATADTVALLQKYPSYEYSTSGGAVQRFDDVSVIPHNIGVTVHGATDDDSNSVTNPTVNVYGKNLASLSGWENKSQPGNIGYIVKGQTYTLSFTATQSNTETSRVGFSLRMYNTSTDISGTSGFRDYGKITVTFIAPETGDIKYNGYGSITASNVQLEVGDTATDYEEYIEPQTVTVPMTFAEGEAVKISTINAVSPTMTIVASDDNGLINTVDVTYNRDVGKAIAALGIS